MMTTTDGGEHRFELRILDESGQVALENDDLFAAESGAPGRRGGGGGESLGEEVVGGGADLGEAVNVRVLG